MGGRVDWTGLPFVVEMLGIDDVEQLIRLSTEILQNRG